MALTFDFITHEEFRSSLEADYRELEKCLQASAWKSVLVLAGSIVEAVLIDYLLASDYQRRSGKDPLKMELAEAITICQSEGVLKQRTAELCSVVRSYRNLIHPGRVIRLGENVDENNARIAHALIGVIVEEVANRRRQTYGLTAEQIVSKLERDSSAAAILPHLLADANDREKERMLLQVLPARYFELDRQQFEFDITALDRMRVCFRMAFDMVSDETKEKVARRYVSILREEGEYQVMTYGTAFFRCTDLAYLDPNNVALVKEHVLSRMKEDLSDDVLKLAQGMENYLYPKDVDPWIDPILRRLVSSKTDKRGKTLLAQHVERAHRQMPEETQKALLRRLEAWKDHLNSRGQLDAVATVVQLEGELTEEVPF